MVYNKNWLIKLEIIMQANAKPVRSSTSRKKGRNASQNGQEKQERTGFT